MKAQLMVLVFAMSCSPGSKEPTNLIDYFRWSDGKTREFVCQLTDTTMVRVFIDQQQKQVAEDIWDLSYSYKRPDSIPFSAGIERIHGRDKIELISVSLFELDTANRPIEIKSQIIKGGLRTLDGSPLNYEFLFTFKVDTACTLNAKTDLVYHFQYLDSVKANCLFTDRIDSLLYRFSDARPDILEVIKTLALYVKGKGLIRFEQETNGNQVVYQLKE